MLTAYLTSWPSVLFGLLTVVAAAYGHGGKYLMKVKYLNIQCNLNNLYI